MNTWVLIILLATSSGNYRTIDRTEVRMADEAACEKAVPIAREKFRKAAVFCAPKYEPEPVQRSKR